MFAQLVARLRGRHPRVKRVWSKVQGGFVVPPSHLEIIVADHCNISCRSCNHASPAMSRWFADPEQVGRDCAVLARVYRPRRIKVLGGEPLLHKNLAAVVRAARATGLGSFYTLVTNGMLLSRMSDELWRCFDEVEVSGYPGIAENLAEAEQRASQLGVQLKVVRFESFRATITTAGTDDQALVQRIYTTCKLANVWGCHGIRDGYLYKCPQSMYIPRLIGRSEEVDRLPIDEKLDTATLMAFLNSTTPLESCRNCLGSVGKLEPHRQLPRSEWADDVKRTSEEMLDRAWLERCEHGQERYDDCRIEVSQGFRPPPRDRR